MKEREKSNERKSIMIGHHNQNEIHNKIKKIDEKKFFLQKKTKHL